MNVGQALNDPTTQLGKMAIANKIAFEERKAAALKIVEDTGCTLEEAFARVWGVS